MSKSMAPKKRLPAKVYKDATINAVMVNGEWYDVAPGTWTVDVRGPFLHATWKDHAGLRFSAFIRHVQMVSHESE